jgi:hypothetical protein
MKITQIKAVLPSALFTHSFEGVVTSLSFAQLSTTSEDEWRKHMTRMDKAVMDNGYVKAITEYGELEMTFPTFLDFGQCGLQVDCREATLNGVELIGRGIIDARDPDDLKWLTQEIEDLD